jgi:hypothetical protein
VSKLGPLEASALVVDELAGTIEYTQPNASFNIRQAELPGHRGAFVHSVQGSRNYCRAARTGRDERVSEQESADALGMSEGELYGYLRDLLHEEAAEAAEVTGKSVEEELDSAGFAAAEAASTYAIKLILANNAFITRQLLDLGVLNAGDGEAIEDSDEAFLGD